jgi:ubiquitin-like protein Pup
MAEQEQRRKSAPARSDDAVVEETAPSTEQGDKLKAELDDLLDEIDDVLESNAEDFVKSYVQKGGQ